MDGYCKVSSSFCLVARIDRPDWKEHMAKLHAPWDIKEGLEWVRLLGEAGAEDMYRRCYSKDTKSVDRCDYRNYPASSETVTGYFKYSERSKDGNCVIGKDLKCKDCDSNWVCATAQKVVI